MARPPMPPRFSRPSLPPRPARVVANLAWIAAALLLGSCGSDAGGGTASATDTTSADAGSDAPIGQGVWAQGYSMKLAFTGGQPDGIQLDIDRDLYEIPTAFSFGSTHYVKGEVGFTVADTMTLLLDNGSGGKVETQIEISLNFGLVVGSSDNPVQTDKAGTYPFSCKPPMIRIFFKNTQFRSTCDGLVGSIVITDYANTTGGRMAGTFKGTLQAFYPDPGTGATDECIAAENAKMCSKPDRTVAVEGHFGFTLPEKAAGGGSGG